MLLLRLFCYVTLLGFVLSGEHQVGWRASAWRRELDEAARAGFNQLVGSLPGSGQGWELNEAHSEGFRAGTGVIFAFSVEAHGDKSAREFRQFSKLDSGIHWSELTDEGEKGWDAPWVARIPTFTVAGPAELRFSRKELQLHVPHQVDAGEIRHVRVEKGAEVEVIGSTEIELQDPLKAEFTLPLDKKKHFNFKKAPNLFLKDPLHFQSPANIGKLKVKRIGSHDVAVHQTPGNAVAPRSRGPVSEYQSKNFLQAASAVYRNVLANDAKAAMLRGNVTSSNAALQPKMRVSRVLAASAKARLYYSFPMRLQQTNATTGDVNQVVTANVVVAKDADGNYTLMEVNTAQELTSLAVADAVKRQNNTMWSSRDTVDNNDVSMSLRSPF
mmetsp:Transcript_28968/g.67084  ORF Transcript_28968/g.67084 Transcript_28968/m.67084 type:complete len:385 (+) Transcript_28968:66-1220(+)|eukprot:CAMPEP_0114559494 /NCGR_PEP_ID=MMETSP0114-20121206/10950_1 /TAXON_ID=31324 /ORGANISM="Goniomonas sp, Strain m" /LENGTH=384 /DNA_ID=CAMNT_0001744965 /DNA_START=51 /DNA_END=1205 /DNA_ORIENTATION=-